MLNLKQGSEEWHEFRRNHIGASDAPVIINGIHFDKTVKQLYIEKTNSKENLTSSNYSMRRGIELEPVARSIFEAETGYLMSPDVKEHPTIKFMSASSDGFELDGKCIVEIKCPGPKDHEIALDGAVPEKYIPQLQHQMEVYGMDSMYYMSYRSDDDYTIFQVRKDHEYTNKLIHAEREFWDRVQNRTPPDSTDRDIEEITNKDWIHLVNEWKQNQITKKLCDNEESRIKDELIKLANFRSAQGSGLKLTKYERKGNVVYSNVPELKGVDLEKHRAPSTESWRISSI
jgi:putative phage-type endonuclease